MLKCVKAIVLFVSVAVVPASAFAQASIVGTARDASGAVLPGVTVEASSPALIEKTRSVTTNSVGQYAMDDLRPGTYTVTFTLSGFSTVKREGIALSGTFIATVNQDMSVGGVAEAITVTSEAPVVDVDELANRAHIHRRDDRRDSFRRGSIQLHALVPPSTCRATTSAHRRAPSSACSRSTAGAGTRDRSR